MGDYAKLIADLKLVGELKQSAGRDDIPAQEIEKLVALVNDVADTAGPLLERIPATFTQYTEHNILHCKNLIDLMGRFIPPETLARMNGLELAVLILAALLHDFGMFVAEGEKHEIKRDELKADALRSKQFESFLLGHHDRAAALAEARERGDHARAERLQDALLAEYFRRMHPERARRNVEAANLAGRLRYRDVDISRYVLDVCESHAWGVRESNDPRRPDKSVSSLPTNRPVYNVPLNLQYIACCLRLADIMDFDRSRTPLVVFQNTDFTEERSWEEWNKHLSVVGWVVTDRDVMFRTECERPAFYVAVMEFLDWVDLELAECRRLVSKDAPRHIAERYKLHLPPVVDRTEVEMRDKSYLAGAFRFQLDYERIMRLLMDKSLYPDPSLFLRELLQNSLDACRNREAHAKEAKQPALYAPRICVWDYSDDTANPRIVFQDNGVGMSRKIVENYFMRVGRSYYRSPEFDAERARLRAEGIELEATSQFGIGILSCFMVADRFEVETYRVGSNPLRITIEGPTKYFVIQLLDEPPRTYFPVVPASDADDGPPLNPGTRITIHLRPGEKVDVYDTLNTFAVNVEYDIRVYRPNDLQPRTIPARKWESPQPWVSILSNAVRDEDGHDVGTTRVAENLNEVLVPSVVDLNGVTLPTHLRGSVWLWLLRDGGMVCPRRGYIKMTGKKISLHGLPTYIDMAKRVIWRRKREEDAAHLLQTLQSVLAGKFNTNVELREFETVVQRIGGGLFEIKEIIRYWNSMSPEERGVFHEAISVKRETDPSVAWYAVPGTAKELLRGTYGWKNKSITFGKYILISAFPQECALHGVVLPAGLLSWNPMDGSSEKLPLLAVSGGVRLDVCGPAAPVPAASRLFIDSREANKVLVPLIRSVIRHAFKLAADNPSAAGWGEWIDDLLESILKTSPEIAFEAFRDERELFQGCSKYLVMTGKEGVYLSNQEVIQKFGRWAPVSGRRYANNKLIERQDGLDLSHIRTWLLVVTKVRRQRQDWFWEVDMESDVPIWSESFQVLRKSLWHMQYI